MATNTENTTDVTTVERFFDHRTRERWLRRGLYGIAGLLLVFLWIPLAVMVFLSVAQNASTLFPFEGFTLQHYAATFSDPGLMMALFNSAQVATVAACIATVLGVLASFALARREFPLKSAFRTFGILPMIVPGVVLGIALLIYFRTLLSAIPVVGDLFVPGFLTLVLTHSVYGFPFVLLIVSARLYTFDEQLEEAARDLGASPLETFRDVTLPIIAPAVGAGFLFAWIRSFEDFIRAFFTKGTMDVLTTAMFSMIKYGAAPKMNAISAFIVLVIAILLAVAMNLGNVTQYVAGGPDE
ncbi:MULTISPECIES: ABC transporter permease [Halorubrum]|jgi:ABC-type spermidine/putrescine transport system permease subunit II|uniref:Spermidine/putrescine transport system permease protein n=2 Tax=Halorubrum TaxID=56688 RepID=A0A521CXF0_9EURY|nr:MULTISPECIES: ABC transporter permease [Halorubrum]OYR56065.1 spermidine/putrescine ABC transporter permease [Halorubrum halodurans]SMO63340.1 spermidine/putrescine transport system permease protein [Halorubrum cibi]